MKHVFVPLMACVAGALALPAIVLAQPGAEIAHGRRLFLQCASCHAVTAAAPGRIGPSLKGIAGRKAGTVAGYTYSSALRAAAFDWTDVKLDAWLSHPDAVVPGTAMAFAGMADRADRKALIAYLKSLGE